MATYSELWRKFGETVLKFQRRFITIIHAFFAVFDVLKSFSKILYSHIKFVKTGECQ